MTSKLIVGGDSGGWRIIVKREEGRGKREEGRGKREEGRGKREEGDCYFLGGRGKKREVW